MNYYPISLTDIRKKVAKKKVAKRAIEKSLNFTDLQNIKEITNEYGETLVRVDGEIPVDLDVTNGQRFLFISYDQSKYSHGIHKYPAKFFPELPRWLIKRYSQQNDIILDPFTGSATTNIEALLCKRHSVGIDIDPFARLLAKVKTTPLNKDELDGVIEQLLQKLLSYKPKFVSQIDIPEFPYRDNWFNKEILLELSYIKKIIYEIVENNDVLDFCKICFSSIIRNVSNADDNCTRTVVRKSLNKQIYPSMALTKFAENLLVNSLRIIEFSKYFPKNISVEFPVENDARYFTYSDYYFDIAITSPPYANAVDYPRTHQLEMYMLGLANGSLNHLKKIHVGTEVVKADEYRMLHKIEDKEADKKLKAIFAKDPRRSYIAFKYLHDMKLNLKEVYRTLKPNGRYIIVVGNNKIRGELFESWKYLMNIAEQVGFKIENYFGSEIIKHFIKVPREERINTDWILILQK
jgi:DNA modification methylase